MPQVFGLEMVGSDLIKSDCGKSRLRWLKNKSRTKASLLMKATDWQRWVREGQRKMTLAEPSDGYIMKLLLVVITSIEIRNWFYPAGSEQTTSKTLVIT